MPSIPSLVQRLLRRFGRGTPPNPTLAAEDIPKYPPFLRGLPAFHPDLLLQTQEPLLRRLQDQLKLTDAQFTAYILPCLRNYAAYVHLLPASQNHHHRGAGGLLRHGLEVAERAAAIAAEKAFFTADTVPAVKRAIVVEWQAASALAGLCHDLGKPIADVEIGSEDGGQTWDPFDPEARTIFDWCQRHQLERYYLRWRKNRHQLHETEGILVVPRILSEATLSWIGGTDPRIRMQLTQSIARGADAPGSNLIAPIVTEADAYSVRADLRKWSSTTGVEMLAIPSQRYILDAMRELVHTGKWRINQAGGRVFVTTHGALIPWPGPDAAGMDVVNYLRKNEIPGISRDPDNLADILIDTAIAVPLKLPHGDMRYWRARITLPEERDLELTCLRIPDENYLIDHHIPPLAAELRDLAEDAADPPEDGDTSELEERRQTQSAPTIPRGSEPSSVAEPQPRPTRKKVTAAIAEVPPATTTSSDQTPLALPLPDATPAPKPPEPVAIDNPRAVSPESAPPRTPPPGSRVAPDVDLPAEPTPVASPTPVAQTVLQRQLQAAFPHVGKITPAVGSQYLRQRDPLGERLVALAARARETKGIPDWLELAKDGVIWLHYPQAFASVDTQPIPGRPELAASSLFAKNPLKSTSALHDQTGRSMLRLDNQVAFHWVACVLAPQEDAEPDTSTQGPVTGDPSSAPSRTASSARLILQRERTLRPADVDTRPAGATRSPGPFTPQPEPAALPVTGRGNPAPSAPRRDVPETRASDNAACPPAQASAPRPTSQREHRGTPSGGGERRSRPVVPAVTAPPSAPEPTAAALASPVRAPSPFRSPLAEEPVSAASAESTPPASPPPAAPELDNPTDPFIERLRLLAAQGGLCAGLTTVDDGFEIHSAHKMAIAKQLDLKPKALDYLLSRHGQPRNGPEGTVYWIAGR